MKRLMSLLILLFIMISLVIPISHINSNELFKMETSNIKTQEIISSIPVIQVKNIVKEDTYEIAIQEMQEKMTEIETIENKKEWFIAYKEIVNEYCKLLDPPETIYDYFSDEEIKLICQVIETECYDQDFIQKVNVANTILSRYWDGNFGETIEEIITEPNQFVYGREIITEDTILALEYAFMFETNYEGSLYFQSIGYMEIFNGAKYIGFDGCHWFYK